MRKNYPFIFEDALPLSAWVKMLVTNVVSFFLLSYSLLDVWFLPALKTEDLYHLTGITIIQQLVPPILFLGINFSGFYWAVGKRWRELFSKIKARNWGWILLLILFSVVTAGLLGQIANGLFGHETNSALNVNIHHIGGWFAFFTARVANLFQLLGEEFLAIIPFLAFAQLAYHWGTSKKTAVIIGLLFSSFLFGIYHLPTYNYNLGYIMLSLFFSRIIMTLGYVKTKSIWGSFAVHYLYDFVVFFISFLTATH